jgi:hypothetical protein
MSVFRKSATVLLHSGGTALAGREFSAPRQGRRAPSSSSATRCRPATASPGRRLAEPARQAPEQKRLDYSVTNASISGETTSGGRTRLDCRAGQSTTAAVVVIALGANDGLRGLPVKTMRDNLTAMAEAAQKKNARVLIVGQRLPPNYGPYATQFHEAFADVAKEKARPRSSTSCSTASPRAGAFPGRQPAPDGRGAADAARHRLARPRTTAEMKTRIRNQ